jgi:hypothetical protein
MIRKALALIDRGSITLSEMAMELELTEAQEPTGDDGHDGTAGCRHDRWR